MNKTVLGFVFGIAIVVAGGVGFMFAKSLSEAQKPIVATPAAPVAAAAKPPILQNMAAVVEKAKAATPAPVTKVAESAPAAAPAPAPAAAMTPAPSGGGTNIVLSRAVSSPTYSPGGTVDVALRLELEGSEKVTALGIEETIPEGFTFDSLVGDSKPDIVPEKGKGGTVNFAWITVPAFPAAVSYRIKAADGTTGVREISGQTLMRGSGPEIRSAIVKTPLTSGEAGNTPAPTPAPAPAEAAPAPVPAPAPAAAMPAPLAAPAAPAATPAASAEDAQKKLAEAAERMRKAEEDKKNTPPVEVANAIAAGGYTPGQPLEVSTSLSYAGTDPLTALALVVTLPDGWTFDKVTGGAAPAVSPPAGKAGNATFIYVDIPKLPATVTYTVNVPASEKGEHAIVGKAAFRTSGSQIEGPPASTPVPSK